MTYLPHPAHYAPADFRALVQGLKFDKGWKPEFPTLHNTGVPSLKAWLAMGATPQERWGANLNAYYRGLGWHAGPHLVVCPDYVWNLCDLEADGVSVSCWNRKTLGIEMVGNYEVGGDDFASGPGAKVRDNAVWALACLTEHFGWSIADTLHFHRECAQDHHACPGSRVAKGEIVQRVNALLETWRRPAPIIVGGYQPTSGLTPPIPTTGSGVKPAPAPIPAPARRFDLTTVAGVQSALVALGYRIAIDGDLGPDTRWAVRAFQAASGLAVDGDPGPITKGALSAALAKLAA